MLHQSPCSVPGTRRMKATPFPVRSALAGHMITRWRRNAMPTSSTAHVTSATRICAIESRNSNATWPRTCSETITTARCRRGSRHDGSNTGYDLPRTRSVGRPRSTAGAPITWKILLRCRQGLVLLDGASRDRTGDLHAASVALSQLSYGPTGSRQSSGGRRERRPLDGRDLDRRHVVPELLEPIVGARLRREEVQDDVEVVGDDPVAFA